MKKIFLLFILIFFSSNAYTEIYHGIDIDEIYKSGDWNNKNDIIQLIDDYTLVLKYQDDIDNCPDTLPENLNCYDKIAKEIITNLYVYPETNLVQYTQLKEALSDAYGLKNCRNKHTWPNGNLCENESEANLASFLKEYIQDLITQCKRSITSYTFILDKYK